MTVGIGLNVLNRIDFRALFGALPSPYMILDRDLRYVEVNTAYERVLERAPVAVSMPPPVLCTDNGAMIAAAAFAHLDKMVAPEAPLDIRPTVKRRPPARRK